MQAADRAAFEEQVKQLLAGFDRKPTPERIEAYWRGLSRMPLGGFSRVVDHALSEQGPDEIPTPRQCWNLYRGMRVSGPAKAQEDEGPPLNRVEMFANRALYVYLCQRGAASTDSLIELVRAKNAITRSIGDPEDVDPEELREVFVGAFDKHWQSRTPEETAGDFEHHERTHKGRKFTPEELARIRA